MLILTYLKLLTKVGFKRLGISFISNFGLLWLLIEPAALFFPEKLNFGWLGYLWLVLISLIIALIQRFPRLLISSSLSSPDSQIEIKVGDLFKQKSHLVIGFNDVFDTELGEIIKLSSIQGQFLSKVYNNDRIKLDTDIKIALEKYENQAIQENDKAKGKVWRYPIGTTITLYDSSSEQKYFLSAYGYMSNDLVIKSNSDYLWTALHQIWEQIHSKGHGTHVSIPVIGSDLARIGLSRMLLIKFIIISFIMASREKFITKKLTIMVYSQDLDYVDLYELKEFLESACV
ncbi:macro domain-containing protein [Cyanobacterium aponinum]|uniref:macro domain-containing protein n=1 Tax=Cyanobacterium aponinum TaxID=379064 RepID=UPI0012BAFC37